MKNCSQQWKDLPVREKIAIITAVAAFIVGWGMSIAGFWLPPIGEVADSVLWILGQALIYAASVFGLTGYFTSERHRKMEDIEDETEQ